MEKQNVIDKHFRLHSSSTSGAAACIVSQLRQLPPQKGAPIVALLRFYLRES